MPQILQGVWTGHESGHLQRVLETLRQ